MSNFIDYLISKGYKPQDESDETWLTPEGTECPLQDLLENTALINAFFDGKDTEKKEGC